MSINFGENDSKSCLLNTLCLSYHVLLQFDFSFIFDYNFTRVFLCTFWDALHFLELDQYRQLFIDEAYVIYRYYEF